MPAKGEIRTLIQTPGKRLGDLGDIVNWPQPLKTIFGTILFANTPMLVLWGKDLTVLYNDAFIPILGGRHPEALGKPAQQVWKDIWTELEPIFNTIKETKEGSTFEDFPFFLTEGNSSQKRYFTFSPGPIVDEAGEVNGVLASVTETTEKVKTANQNDLLTRDTTIETGRLKGILSQHKGLSEELQRQVDERTSTLKKMNEDLKRSEERYHKMTEEVQDYAILLLDTEGNVQNWNNGARSIKGYTEEEIVSKNFRKFYSKEDLEAGLPEKLLAEAKSTGRAAQEGWRVRKDGTKFWASVVITALHDTTGEVIGFSKVTRDLTERKKAEEQMKQYTVDLEVQNRELEQFAYVASHDLQEPLRKIRTFLDLVKSNLNSPVLVAKYFEKIENAAERMTELIRSILNYSKLSVSNEEFLDVDLNEILNGVLADLELLIHEKNAQIIRKKMPVVKGSETQLHQLFLNMVSNSLKFSSENPVIELDFEFVKGSDIEKRQKVVASKKYLQLKFKDNGIGFDQKYAEQVFTIFQRLHSRESYAGTGIGLALCRRIVENHHGVISVVSEPGKGTEFSVYLPA